MNDKAEALQDENDEPIMKAINNLRGNKDE